MTNTPDNFSLDIRIRERMLHKNVLSTAALEAHMASLKDSEADSVPLDLEQPAMTKPPVVVAPVVQPVPVPRSSSADLPAPPPGLIKESATPPYTPMVIESSIPPSATNGEAVATAAAAPHQAVESAPAFTPAEVAPVAPVAIAAPAVAAPAPVAVAAPMPAEPVAAEPEAPAEASAEIDDDWGNG